MCVDAVPNVSGVPYTDDVYRSLQEMQKNHFWYRGRHRFLVRLLKTIFLKNHLDSKHLEAIDIGGGCGGWCSYLVDHEVTFQNLTLAEHSLAAIDLARKTLPSACNVMQMDLLSIAWRKTWDIVFLLDVLEHMADDATVLKELSEGLSDRGILFLTVPAMRCLWSDYDVQDGHFRRYSASELVALANGAGLEIMDVRYFNCFLTPILWLSRIAMHTSRNQPSREKYLTSFKLPNPVVNSVLTGVFSAETPIGHWMRFPFGSSLVMVAKKRQSF